MQTLFTPPVCPKCGHPNPEKIRERPCAVTAEFFAPPVDAAKQIIAVFRCRCGMSFTSITGDPEARDAVAASSDDIKNHALAAQAIRLQMRIGRLVDDPNYQIVGFEGETYIAEIRELAEQCEAEGLQVAAARLHQLGRDVMRRWAE